MQISRRSIFSAGLGLGLAATAVEAGPRRSQSAESAAAVLPGSEFSLEPNSDRDQTVRLQAAIDEAHRRGAQLLIPPGRLRVGEVRLRRGTRLLGSARTSVLEFAGGSPFLVGEGADQVAIEDLVLDGAMKPLGGESGKGLISLAGCPGVSLRNVEVRRSARDGVFLSGCSGGIVDCVVTGAAHAGIKSLDGEGLQIAHSRISDCANNGILVWRSKDGEDGTIVTANRIERIAAQSGGTGQNGNGINVFRAGGVLVTGNRITDCAYSAVRGNAASNIQMIANSCARAGEVAIYSEFGFEGALIANNSIEVAATGISVTNFNEGGRLAVIQGNLIRNLSRREHETEDKRGEGITVEADAAVTGNVIESAPTAGIVIGWGSYMRDVAATGNLIRNARVGIAIASDAAAGACLVANNMISGATDGAIRAMERGRVHGPDLARHPTETARATIIGNMAV